MVKIFPVLIGLLAIIISPLLLPAILIYLAVNSLYFIGEALIEIWENR